MNTEQNNQGPWWKPAAIVFGRISVWIIVPIVIPFVFGYFSHQFHTGTRGFFGLLTLSFLISLFMMIRILRKYIRTVKEEAKNGNTGNTAQ